jgi:hypothetical protein
VGSNDAWQNDPPPKQQQNQPSNPESKHCKKCGSALGSGTVTTRFGVCPAYEAYVCGACGFIGWVAISPAPSHAG